jgi:hypothetical protein
MKKTVAAVLVVFTDAGGVGFWTKSDAACSFDDFIVEREKSSVKASGKGKD